ncbi:tetraacyldisaccharide 4'-kinase [Parendozoicomonas haliclonae]|uniref:Tetraacyldisaccharide 4'-kinase n=1 Tax=Parendozoicomonas haliclonae TaxID=1960125 RepID=A0A1X7ALZ4_9GAMM|nr:tetraacyldisaccharide 4'-kinase [Parendozoicomonas haliclonae]SMA49190.1 Tetraacyldisaccharide 4'-kinase [Parendozoicomonas haliclonae]
MSESFGWKARLEKTFVNAWYQPVLKPWLIPFLPLSALVAFEARRRLRAFRQQPPAGHSVPVIVVGNVTAGGTGKTPLAAVLVEKLIAQGYRPGIISRGYGAQASDSILVTADSDPAVCGDEPVMLAGLTGIPVVVDRDRNRAVDYLLKHTDCNLVISDDGLQHYRLARQLEIAVVDGQRLLGNGCCLPAGPLREPASRLSEVDFVISNGQPDAHCSRLPLMGGQEGNVHIMTLQPGDLRPVSGDEQGGMPQSGDVVYGVAGIGNPERFFDSLSQQGFQVNPQPFPDHHPFSVEDFSSLVPGAVIMTAKDAVKCRPLVSSVFPEAARCNWWYLPVKAELPEVFWSSLFSRLAALSSDAAPATSV